jgi:serine/threonine protein kinase
MAEKMFIGGNDVHRKFHFELVKLYHLKAQIYYQISQTVGEIDKNEKLKFARTNVGYALGYLYELIGWKPKDDKLKQLASELSKFGEELGKELNIKRNIIEKEIFKVEEEEVSFLSPSAQYRSKYFLDYYHLIHNHAFIDRGRKKDYKDLEELHGEVPDRFFEIIVADPLKHKELKNFMAEIKQEFDPSTQMPGTEVDKDVRNFFKRLISKVSQYFGGFNVTQEECRKCIVALQYQQYKSEQKKANQIRLCDIRKGLCRHRAIAFKIICDMLGIKCRLLRGWMYAMEKDIETRTNKKFAHAWNSILLKGKEFIVDCMNFDCLIEKDGVHNNDWYWYAYETLAKDLEKEMEYKKEDKELAEKVWKNFEEQNDNEIYRMKFVNEKREPMRILTIKRLKIPDDEEKKNKFFELLNLSKFINHENLVKIIGDFDTRDEKNNNLYVSYDHLNMNLTQMLEKLENVDPSDRIIHVLLILIRVARGIRHLHLNGIYHFAINPSNILINWDEKLKEIEEVQIADFAGNEIQLFMNSLKTKKRSEKFIPQKEGKEFIAPELLKIFNGEEIKIDKDDLKKCDVYSFGKLMQKMNEKEYFGSYTKLIQLMERCLNEKDPLKRPTLEEIIPSIVKLMQYKFRKQ